MSSYSTIEKMSKMMDKMGLTELKMESGFLFGIWKKEIHLSKQPKMVASPQFASTPAAPLAKTSCEDSANPAACVINALKSPMVGVVFLSPEPGAAPFVTVGATVKAGDTVALIEAMKTFNPVKSERAGTVKEILVTDGQAVEFDTPLVVIE
ncbi:MAG: acetyl-CoA carboxylase biotin carboxyl carrier protein [Alphaproteobacteria bacterium]|nr:acetyl-CoA carboxylase biotin carboxyl carrier protein [Alphaproteobacteria bacterium]